MNAQGIVFQEWRIPELLTFFFFGVVLSVVFSNSDMFFKTKWMHAFTGLLYLTLLLVGFVTILFALGDELSHFIFDVCLGIFGVLLTLTATKDFPHKNLKNFASGTLDAHATVTFHEMIEHCFYQGLNLVQIVYIHAIDSNMNPLRRYALCLAATSPWAIREFFPVHRFSDNYNKIDVKSTPLIRILYRLKKYQYVFYKHFLLHGLNISIAVYGTALANEKYFRLYWLLLNTSYVMEFFLQTLVKKNYMGQSLMLLLQNILMLASTIAALQVLQSVNIGIALVSLILNFSHRLYLHDITNTAVILLGLFLSSYTDRYMALM